VNHVFETPQGTAVALQIASTGAIRTVTMRAFDEDQMKGIIAKMG
jgi:uncharacterized protein with GYD domain